MTDQENEPTGVMEFVWKVLLPMLTLVALAVLVTALVVWVMT